MADEHNQSDEAESSGTPERPERPEGGAGGEDVELQAALEELESIEARRKRMGVLMGIGAVILIVAAVLLLWNFRNAFVAADVDLGDSGAETKNIQAIDDPQCRRLIDDVTQIKNRYYAMERRIEEAVPGGSREEIRSVLAELDAIEAQLRKAQALSNEAELRFDRSEEELKQWFDYTFNELAILQDVAAETLLEMRQEEGGEPAGDAGNEQAGDEKAGRGTTADAGQGDAGSVERDTGLPMVRDRGQWELEEQMSPEKRRQKALVSLHESFDSFKVWHTAYKHPCGDNDEDEEPWRPEGWTAPDAGGSGKAAPTDQSDKDE